MMFIHNQRHLHIRPQRGISLLQPSSPSVAPDTYVLSAHQYVPGSYFYQVLVPGSFFYQALDPAHQGSVLILPPRDIQALPSQNYYYDTEILHRVAVKGGIHFPYFFNFNLRLTFTFFQLLDTVVSVVVPSCPRCMPYSFITYRVHPPAFPLLVDLHRMLLTHALALFASPFVHKKKSLRVYTSMHSGNKRN